MKISKTTLSPYNGHSSWFYPTRQNFKILPILFSCLATQKSCSESKNIVYGLISRVFIDEFNRDALQTSPRGQAFERKSWKSVKIHYFLTMVSNRFYLTRQNFKILPILFSCFPVLELCSESRNIVYEPISRVCIDEFNRSALQTSLRDQSSERQTRKINKKSLSLKFTRR